MHSRYKAVWWILKVILIAYKELFIAGNHNKKPLLFKVKYVIDRVCKLFDD